MESDRALSQVIQTIRRTLGDDSRALHFIRAMSRHGYRFVYPVPSELVFDGSADRGLRYYAEHLARRAVESGPASEPAEAVEQPPAADTPLEKNPRQKLADWAFDRTPGVAETAVRYFGHAANRGHFVANDTFDLNGAPQAFDFAMAGAVFAQRPLNAIAHCIASVTRALSPSGRFSRRGTRIRGRTISIPSLVRAGSRPIRIASPTTSDFVATVWSRRHEP